MQQNQHAADRLCQAIAQRAAPVCVGIDPVVERLPDSLQPGDATIASAVDAIGSFSRHVLNTVAPHVPCVKFQSACFERYGSSGVHMLELLVSEAQQQDLIIILDGKRGDIGVSADHYAAAVFGPRPDKAGPAHPDWVTVNGYFGKDGICPFLQPGCGVFVMVRTSNPGGDQLQQLQLADGSTLAQQVARMVADIGSQSVGEFGYSALGAVVGATKSEDATKLREIMPQQIFLVPGFGAQGGTVDDVRCCFDGKGLGAIVTASRSVIYAFDDDSTIWVKAIGEAAEQFADEVGHAAGLR